MPDRALSSADARERRRFQRVRGPFDASWTGRSGCSKARIWDLSTGGCYIEALTPLPPGERLTIEIPLPEGLVSAGGQVVYSVANQGFAVSFSDLHDDTVHALQQAVERLVGAGQGV